MAHLDDDFVSPSGPYSLNARNERAERNPLVVRVVCNKTITDGVLAGITIERSYPTTPEQAALDVAEINARADEVRKATFYSGGSYRLFNARIEPNPAVPCITE